MPKGDEYIDAPQTLTGLFPPDSDDDDDDDNDSNNKDDDNNCTRNDVCYEIQSIVLCGRTLKVRQYDYHSHNANRVWPGTFNLTDYLLQREKQTLRTTTTCDALNKEVVEEADDDVTVKGKYMFDWGNVLELGTATGLLAIRLCLESRIHNKNTNSLSKMIDSQDKNAGNDFNINKDDMTTTTTRDVSAMAQDDNYCCNIIVTSDVQDEENDVQNNLKYNYQINDISNPPIHIPHTWGTGWQQSVELQELYLKSSCTGSTCTDNTTTTTNNNQQYTIPHYFDTIIASDILLYVNAYEALVRTLQELFALNIHKTTKFVMSWNRRMKESSEFFTRMNDAGFHCTHEGKCVYTFVLKSVKCD